MTKPLAEQIAAILEKTAPAKPAPGHNSGAALSSEAVGDKNERDAASDERLRLLIERVERLEEEKKGIADDIRDVMQEAKAVGYSGKMLNEMKKLRKMTPDDRANHEAERETYKNALGMG